MDWEDLKALDGIARGGTISGAARTLGLSHATVSRRVSRLEEELGAKLIDRVAGGARLTVLGEALAARAHRMAEEADAIGRQALDAKATPEGRVTIAAPPGLSADFVVPACRHISQLYPKIDLHIRAAMTAVSLDRMEADLAVRMVKPDGASHSRRLLGTLKYGVYVSSSRIEEAADMRWIGFSALLPDLPEREVATKAAGDRGIAFEFDELIGQVAAIRAGIGKGVLPSYVGARFADLVSLPEGEGILNRQIWLAQHLDVRNSASVRAVAEVLAKQFETELSLRT